MLLSCFESRSTNYRIWKHEGFVYISKVQAQPQKTLEWCVWVGSIIMILCDIVMGKMKEVLNVVGFISIFVHNWQWQQGGKPCICIWELETNAHSTHLWKCDNMCYYNKFNLSVIVCSFNF